MTEFSDQSQGDVTRNATVVLNADVAGYSQAMNQAAAQTNALSRGVDGLSAKLHNLTRAAGNKLIAFGSGDLAAMAAATATAANFQKQLSVLSATAAVTGTSMRGIKSGIESTFTSFPVSRAQVVALTQAISGLGVTSARDLTSLTQTFIKLGAATGEPMEQLASGLIQLSRLMGVTGSGQIGNFANSLLTVSKNAGVSASGVLSFAQAIAPLSRQAGISEGAVLGIATAFQKAGANGYQAATAFNSILSDITTSAATGSPELAKYANLLGVTTAQFQKMNPTTAITDIFNQLTKQGPQAIAVLDTLGISGTRAQSAISAVVQSGQLQQSVAQALGSQGNQKNLNKGSSAAFDNLSSSLTDMRNQFTQLGTVIGTTFLKPLSMAAQGVAGLGAGLNHMLTFVKPLLPVLATLGALLAPLGMLAGTALHLTGALGAVALGRTAMHYLGTGARRAAGTEQNAFGKAILARDAEGKVGMLGHAMMWLGGRAGAPFAPEGRIGQLVRGAQGEGEVGSLRSLSTWRNLLLAAPFRGLAGLNRSQIDLLRASRDAGYARTRTAGAGMREAFRNWRAQVGSMSLNQALRSEAGNLGSSYAGLGREYALSLGSLTRMGGRGLLQAIGPRAIWQSVASLLTGGTPGVAHLAGRAFDRLPSEPTMRPGDASRLFGRAVKDMLAGPSAAFAQLRMATGELTKSLLSTAGAGLRTGVVRGTAGLLGLAGRGIGLLGMGAGKLMSAAFSPWGIAAMIGGQFAWNRFRGSQQNVAIDQFLNPIQRYNEMLGTTTTNLATFGNALASATTALGQQGGQGSLTYLQASRVTAADIAAKPSSPKVSAFSALKKYGGSKDVQGLLGAFSALPISDPKQLQAAKEDALAAGFDQATVSQALALYAAGGGPNTASGIGPTLNLRAAGQTITASEGRGTNWSLGSMVGDANQSKSGSQLLGLYLSGIGSQAASDTVTKGSAYAAQQALASYSQLLAPLTQASAGTGFHAEASAAALAHALSTITKGGYGGYNSTITNQTHGVRLSENMTPAQEQQAIIKILQSTHEGRSYLAGITGSGGTIDPAKFGAFLSKLSQGSGTFNQVLATSGPLGKLAASDSTLQSLLGTGQSNQATQLKSMNELEQAATQAGGGLSGAVGKLMDFQNAIGDSTNALSQQAAAALQDVMQRQQYAAPFQTRAQNFGQAVSTYQSATHAYNQALILNSPDAGDLYKTQQQAKANYEQSLADQQSYLQQVYQQAQQYGIQREREAHDENTQIARTNLAFYRQMSDAHEDYLIQRQRAQLHYDEQLADQAQTAAQSIYDPYTRVQAKFTIDAGTLLQNLQDQNSRIAGQQKQLQQLSGMGLSTQAIQELDLANPNNSQQLTNIVNTVTSNPRLIAQINAAVKTRLQGTAALTQNDFNLQFVQGQRQFTQQLSETAQDYERQSARAVRDHQTTLDQMAEDYTNMINRSAQDLQNAMAEVTGNFGDMWTKTMAMVANSVAKYSPAAAKVITDQLNAIAAAFPGLHLTDASQYNGGDLPPLTPQGITRGGRTVAYADGGISLSDQIARVSERGMPEAHIPLNERGQAFMTALITKSLAQAIVSVSRSAPVQPSLVQQDASIEFSGPVSVTADDPNRMARELAAKAKLKRLTSPARR